MTMKKDQLCLRYAIDNASYRGATVLSVKNKLRNALKKLKTQNFREGRDEIKFMGNGNDFVVNVRGQSGDPSHVSDILVMVKGSAGMDRTSFNAFGSEQSAIQNAVAWVQNKLK